MSSQSVSGAGVSLELPGWEHRLWAHQGGARQQPHGWELGLGCQSTDAGGPSRGNVLCSLLRRCGRYWFRTYTAALAGARTTVLQRCKLTHSLKQSCIGQRSFYKCGLKPSHSWKYIGMIAPQLSSCGPWRASLGSAIENPYVAIGYLL